MVCIHTSLRIANQDFLHNLSRIIDHSTLKSNERVGTVEVIQNVALIRYR